MPLARALEAGHRISLHADSPMAPAAAAVAAGSTKR